MPREGFVNKFPEGLDKDSDEKIRKNTTYKDAWHVQLTGDGKYGALQNLKGTTQITNIVSSIIYTNINVMGAYSARTLVNTTSVEDCIYIFYGKNVASVYTFHIDIFRVSSGVLYSAFSSTETSDVLTALMDAFTIGEAGVDTLYYTVSDKPLGRIRCILNTASPTITERQTELLKRYPSNTLQVSNILYTPKSEAGAANDHKINLVTNTDTGDDWTGTAELDNDTTGGDEFDVAFAWDLYIDNQTTEATARIEVEEWNGAAYVAVAGFPQEITDNTVGGETTTGGTFTVNVDWNPYNSNPIIIRLYTDALGASDIATASIEITNIYHVAGGDTYSMGTFLFKEVTSP
jgi:hypothetical protein